MARDPEKLDAFNIADALVPSVYELTRWLPPEERYGLQSQIRRAAVSVTSNLIEGCTRPTQRDFARFVVIARGSASEVRYLVQLTVRLGFIESGSAADIIQGYDRVARALHGLSTYLEETMER